MTNGAGAGTGSSSGFGSAFDVAVVGAGIVGLGVAYAAVQRGLSVVVVERRTRIAGASIRNFGHLCIGAQTGTARRYGDAAREKWLALSRDAGFWLRESGTLVAARHADELALLEAAAADGGIRMLDAAEFTAAAPVAPGTVVGGAKIAPDLQTNPREAGEKIAAHLARLGVEFRVRTAATGLVPGDAATGTSPTLLTSRGPIFAGRVVLAVNHDIDELAPELAERAGVERCALDMLRVQAALSRPLDAPLLTGWSLIRYGRFAGLPEAATVRARLHGERPDLAAIDLNQMYTQLPDGSLLLGDTHATETTASPFQAEDGQQAIIDEACRLFGFTAPRVIERWQGVYAKSPEEFLLESLADGIVAASVTTGIGMTTGLGFAEHALETALAGNRPNRARRHEQQPH
ncbi:TIGR03364 family FAD-dependent oxidoreductase [Leucobacter sp. CSA2]|uniref:TIGR03364 family FAD-dependent oxidoreductase n=1 Tax=Leucobacter edaphi TaxID=2796472 RepID=A0A934QC19_9MICO|nr:TIGR03364 family FAD-dependent oxidoreductase [Leucobacter edaphi]MBK0421886.1 TIGR03364 family FAD-dependent oxidoreductase [Leucobacter edaphi]